MNILHVTLSQSTFVKKDQKILEACGHVITNRLDFSRKYLLPWVLLGQLIKLIFYSFKIDIYVCQFAGYHSFLPCLFARIMGKKSIIISGGTDCVSFPGIGYGNFYRPILRDFTRWSYLLCTDICPKHQSLWLYDYQYDPQEPSKQGIKAFIPNIEKNVTVIYNGYDPEKWPLLDIPRKKNSFITVSGAFEYPFQVQLKGIDLLLQAAERLPEYTFTIAGVPDWKKLEIRSENVTILPPVNHEDLYKLFNEHEFYVQISMAEGFPNALCEAMLCGCTPIVSNVFSMPEIVGQTVNILKNRNKESLVQLLKNAILFTSAPISNRKKISLHFTETIRKEKLSALLKSYNK
jgi:glycosyltransferase involved in cell wall biosynthesis